jgi:hypothetical protein
MAPAVQLFARVLTETTFRRNKAQQAAVYESVPLTV